MSALRDALRACLPLLSGSFRTAHARLFADEQRDRLADRLEGFVGLGVPPRPPPFFAAECTPPLDEVFAPLRPAAAACLGDPGPAAVRALAEAVEAAGCGNLLLLLGQRLTPASLTDARAIPPPRADLLAAADRPHGPRDPLTVAGRALAKHAARSGDAFWALPNGPAAVRNATARAVLERFLEQATWWNVFGHFLHDTAFEVRLPGGHGARWGRDGTAFIGFLEPFDEGLCPSLSPGR
jgi:hypothetical protein